ncbi:MAG: hypothetical protein MUE32_07800, partial [Bacteroidales bacterium]|nr:hypothetical protein [Bacteroidales bacterium]
YELEKAGREDFESTYKRARGFIEAAAINEKATLASSAEIVTDVTKFDPYLRKMNSAIDATAKASLDAFNAWAETRAKHLGLKGIDFSASETEIKAGKLIPVPTSLVTEKGYRGYTDYIGKLDPKIREQYPVKGRMFDTQELGRLCNGKNSALDIKKLIDSQLRQGETDLQDIINYIYILREAGLVSFRL